MVLSNLLGSEPKRGLNMKQDLYNHSLRPNLGLAAGRIGLSSSGSTGMLASQQSLNSPRLTGNVSISNSLLGDTAGTSSLKSSLLSTEKLISDYQRKLTCSDSFLQTSNRTTTSCKSALGTDNSKLATPSLLSGLTLTSCHLNSRPTCTTNILPSSSGKTLNTTASLDLRGKKTLVGQSNSLHSNALRSRVVSGDDTPMEQDSQGGRRVKRVKRHLEETPASEIDSKKPRYNIDWSSVKVAGDEVEVKMEESSESMAVSRPEDKNDRVKDVKRRFINTISASLLRAPNFKAVEDTTRISFVTMCEEIAELDPEFLLKVAIYNRKDLNIRGASSFLLAFAAHNSNCRPFLKKYFKETIVLPSDWIEVAEIYQTFQNKKLSFGSLPNALRRVMVEKFPDFDTYQLGKYNKEKKSKPKKKETKNEPKMSERRKKLGLPPIQLVPDEDSDGDEKEVELKKFTLKQLIRQLHIATPVHHVMSLLGKNYPATREEFYGFNLPGEFDESLAGKRMKLPIPETWETQISMRGNKAKVWQSLIDHKKLPFMAMLRNIRNMLKAGISEKHHQWVISKLTDEGAIANSKQFPFRFFSAYTVLLELEKDYSAHQEKLIEMAEKLAEADEKEVLGGGRPTKKKKKMKERREDQKKNEMRKQLKTDLNYDLHLVGRYRKALDTSVELATNYNVPPIPGVTLILCNVGSSMFKPCTTYKGMGQPRQVVEVGILLGLMCKHSCESSEMMLYADNNHHKTVQLDKAAGILANTASLVKYAQSCDADDSSDAQIPKHLLREILLDRKHVDNIIVLSDGLRYDGPDGEKMEEFLRVYRQLVNPRVLFVSIDLSSSRTGVDAGLVSKHVNDVFLAGFSDQLLRFVAERGDSGQMTYVENIDAKYNLVSKLPATKDTKSSTTVAKELAKEKKSTSAMPIPPSRSLMWRTARVFISSTFLDMHGERDILTRFVFPEIRQWAQKRLVNVLDVDLRWGVSQHATKESGSLSLCLNEVLNADLFIGILGERSGWKPNLSEIPVGEEFDWIRGLPQPHSATALEVLLALRTKSSKECFFFIRSDRFIRDDMVPPKYLDTFAEKDPSLEQLKNTIRISGAEVYDQYPAEWAGVVDSKPMTGGLEKFALRAMEMLKTVIADTYVVEEAYVDELQEVHLWQESLVQAGCERFKGRSGSIKEFHIAYNDFTSGICLIHGETGVGKTTFMCRIAHEMTQTDESTFRHIVCTGYSDMATILRRLCHEMSQEFHLPYDPVYDYYELVEALADLLEKVGSLIQKPYVIIIDGVNYISTEHNAHCANWLPDSIPKHIVFLLSCNTGSEAHRVLSRRQDVMQSELKSLEILDKSVLVKESLAKHGKALDESAFNNQMKFLTGKRGANNPLYLMLACEQLRFHGVFEKVTEKIKAIPQTLPKLMDYILASLEVDFGAPMISRFMKLLYCLPSGATISDMKTLLSVYCEASSNLTWCTAHSLSCDLLPEDLVPALTFTQILHRLGTLLDDYTNSGILRLTYGSVKEAIKKRYLKTSDSELQTHILIAGYYLSVIEKLRPEARYVRYYADVIYHLKCGSQFVKVKELLSDLQFLHCKCSLGLVTSLNTDYSVDLLAKVSFTAERKWSETRSTIVEFADFLFKNTHLLLRTPNQLIQLALNEPDSCVISQSARLIVDEMGIDYTEWLTKPQTATHCLATIQTTTVVHCTAVSKDGGLLAVGGEDCRVHVYSLSNCEEMLTLVGHAHLISDLCFVGSNQLMSASHDKTVSLWDITTGHRLAVMSKHWRRVSSCVSTKLSILTASWDGLVKMWTRDGKPKNDVCRVPSPINAMSLHTDEVYAAIACWDSTVKIYNILTNKRLAVLHGHKSSVRSVCYSTTGRYISSVALDGEVKLWSASNGSQMGSFEGHSLPVRDLCFSLDGDRLITAAEDGRVKVWSGQLGMCVDMWCSQSEEKAAVDAVLCVAINQRCSEIAVGTNLGTVMCFYMYDLSEPHSATKPEEGAAITALCWSTDCSSVMCATSTGSIYKWLILSGLDTLQTGDGTSSVLSIDSSCDWILGYTNDRGSVVVRSYNGDERAEDLTQHSGAVFCCSFNSSGQLLATGGADCKIIVWKTASESELTLSHLTTITQAHLDWVTSLTWSDSVDMLASASNDCLVKLWDFTKSTPPTDPKHILTGHESAVTSTAYKAGCIISTSMDGCIKVWSQKGTEVTSIKCRRGAINTCSLGISLSSKGESEESAVTDWADYMEYEDTVPTQTKTAKAKLRADMVKNVLVAVGTAGGDVQVWNPLEANEAEQYTTTSATLSVCSLANKVISSHLDNTIRVWALPRAAVQSNTEHSVGQRSDCHQITALAQDGYYLVSGSLSGHVSLWDVGTLVPSLLHTFKCSERAISTIAFSSPTKVTAGAENGTIYYMSILFRRSGATVYLHLLKQHNHVESVNLMAPAAHQKDPRPVLSVIEQSKSHDKYIVYGDHTGFIFSKANSTQTSENYVSNGLRSGFSLRLALPPTALSVLSDVKKLLEERGLLAATFDHSDDTATCYTVVNNEHWVGTDQGVIKPAATHLKDFYMRRHRGRVTYLTSYQGILISGSEDCTVKLWRLHKHQGTLELISQFTCPAPITSIACDDQLTSVCSSPSKAIVYIGDKLGEVHRLDFHINNM